jgi:hypothetical protein
MMGAESYMLGFMLCYAACVALWLVARGWAARWYGKARTLRHGANAGLEHGPAGRYTLRAQR